MIPRGLRLKKIPTTAYTEAFNADWQTALSECSLTLMKLIIEQETVKLQATEGEILTAHADLEKFKDAEGYNALFEKMNKNLEKLELSVMQTKKS